MCIPLLGTIGGDVGVAPFAVPEAVVPDGVFWKRCSTVCETASLIAGVDYGIKKTIYIV